MAKKRTKAAPNETLTAENYREWAKSIIAKYDEKGMIFDSMVWSQVIGHYERALSDAQAKLDPPSPNNTEKCVVCHEQYCDFYRDGHADEPIHAECHIGKARS